MLKKMPLFKCKEMSGCFERNFISPECRHIDMVVKHETRTDTAKDGEECMSFSKDF